MFQDLCGDLCRCFVRDIRGQSFCLWSSHLAFDRFCNQMRTQRILHFCKISDQRSIISFLPVIHAGRKGRFFGCGKFRFPGNSIVHIHCPRYIYHLAHDISIWFFIDGCQNRICCSQVNSNTQIIMFFHSKRTHHFSSFTFGLEICNSLSLYTHPGDTTRTFFFSFGSAKGEPS